MVRYQFYSNLTIPELALKISSLPHINSLFFTKSEHFIGSTSKHRFCIGYIPNSFKTSIVFFCGKMTPCRNGTRISGCFIPPLKIVIFPYSLNCFILLLIGDFHGLIAGIIACAFVHGLQILLLSCLSRSKNEVIHFIKNDLDSEILQSKDNV